MKFATLALVGATALGALASAANAQPIRTRVYAVPPGVSADEIRDYRLEQIERRQEMDREALRFTQRAERRMVEDDDDED